MDREQLSEAVGKADLLAKLSREEAEAEQRKLEELARREGECEAKIDKVLDSFRDFLAATAPEGTEIATAVRDPEHSAGPPNSENPINLSVVVGRESMQELGMGTVVAEISAYHYRKDRRMGYETLHEANGFSVRYKFVPDEPTEGQIRPLQTPVAGEEFNTNVLKSLNPHADVDDREAKLGDAEIELNDIEVTSRGTISLLRESAGDPELNPELAARLAAQN